MHSRLNLVALGKSHSVVSIDVDFDGFVDFLQECPLCRYIRELSVVGGDRGDPDYDLEVLGLIEETFNSLRYPLCASSTSSSDTRRDLFLRQLFCARDHSSG